MTGVGACALPIEAIAMSEQGGPGEASEALAMSDLSEPGGTSEPEEVTAVFEAEE